MNSRPTVNRASAVVAVLLIISAISLEVYARGFGGGGFSRGGAASRGGFSGGQERGNFSGGAGQERASSMSEQQGSRQSSVSANQESRQSQSASNQSQRQDASNENVDTRQQGATNRQNNYENNYNNNYYRAPAPGYYPPPNYSHDDGDWDSGSVAVGMVAGAALGAAAASASTTNNTNVVYSQPPSGGLPCAAQTETVNSVVYYRCGQQYYMEAYGSQGPVYMPVAPPAQ